MEKNLRDFLVEWTFSFVKNKDAISKKILEIEKEKGGFDLYVKYKDKEQYFIILPKIADIGGIIERIDDTAYFCIVTLNSKENFGALLKNWNKLAGFRHLSLIFANPFSQNDKKWIVFPHTHNKVCDESALEAGLKAIFETVDEIEEQGFISRLKG